MPLAKLFCRVEAADHDRRLDQFLAQALAREAAGLSRRRIRRLIDAGAVHVDGKRVRVASRRLRPGVCVEVYLAGAVPEEAPTPGAEIGPGHVLYEDHYLIAIDKPAGMPAQATVDDAVGNVYALTRRFLEERRGRATYLALHHRLDRGTSGVMLFSKGKAANRGLARAFESRRLRKVYHVLTAVAETPPAAAWTVRNRLSTLHGSAGGRRVECLESGGRWAETELRILRYFPPPRSLPGVAWIEAVPKTGRTHQIRVHLADSGFPVLGDALYGRAAAERVAAPRLMLHAASLALEHPVTGEALTIESPLPEDFREQVRWFESST